MRVLTSVHADKVSRKLVNEVPRRVLEAVAREEGRRETQVVNELIHRLPKTVEPETISDWVDEALGWLIVRGDVEREPRGVYRCVPPYLVGAVGMPNDIGLRLHGNPRAERDLLRILKTLDARLVHGEAQHYSRSKRDDEQPDLGVVERFIALNQADQSAAAQMCESNGYTVLRPGELVSTLPRKDDVVTPAVQDLTILEGRTPGLWEIYDPTANRAERWNPVENWQSDEARLVRWRSNDDWEGNRSAKIYFHSGGGRVAELGAEMAALWQLYLDDLSWNARTMWWNRNRLWVPNVLPTATLRWLELVAGLRARFSGAWLRLAMDENAAGLARTALSETLGLKFRRGNPPREYHRRGGRHGRRRR